jgi:truncated hemoglobin YjbI
LRAARRPDELLRRQIGAVHRPQAIPRNAFDHAVTLFEETLAEAPLEPEDVQAAVKAFESKRPFILSE